MKKTYLQRGFTLIELLVVIAIIGILSSVVLASLNTARGKGANTAIKANLANMRAQGEIIYDSNTPNSYNGFCTNGSIAAQLISANTALGGAIDPVLANAGTVAKVSCHVAADNSAWAVGAGLKQAESGNTYYCVDSLGASKAGSTVLAVNAVVCP